jgi:hypothetical protein
MKIGISSDIYQNSSLKTNNRGNVNPPSFAHTLDFVPFGTGTTFRFGYSPSNVYFNIYSERRLSISPAVATLQSEIPNIHMIEVYDTITDEYLLDYSRADHFWANTTESTISPSATNKFGLFLASSGVSSFYYGRRIRSGNVIVSSNGNIIRVRVRKYNGGPFGSPNIQLGPPIAEMFFIDRGDSVKPTIVDINGNPI